MEVEILLELKFTCMWSRS